VFAEFVSQIGVDKIMPSHASFQKPEKNLTGFFAFNQACTAIFIPK
jgi:hypothetical protein